MRTAIQLRCARERPIMRTARRTEPEGCGLCKIIANGCPIIEYGSTLYIGMARKKNGGPYKRMANTFARTHAWAYLNVKNLPNCVYEANLRCTVALTAMPSFLKRQTSTGRISTFFFLLLLLLSSSSFFSRPSSTTQQATAIIFTRNCSIFSGAVHWPFGFLSTATISALYTGYRHRGLL